MSQEPASKPHHLAVEVRNASLIYNPDSAPVHALADLDLADQARIRRELPVLANRRPEAYRGLHGIDQSEHR
jgi:hypothetical protein